MQMLRILASIMNHDKREEPHRRSECAGQKCWFTYQVLVIFIARISGGKTLFWQKCQ